MTGLYKQLVATLTDVLPLLGLVMFGDPQVARRFYGLPFESPDIAARAVMGMALMLSLESRHGQRPDRDRAVTLISEGTVKGFFPALEPARRQR